MTHRRRHDATPTTLRSVPGITHSTLTGLSPDPDDPGYARALDGRRYFLTHAADGSTVPIPVELTDEHREELDAARDGAAHYAARLNHNEQNSCAGDVVPLHPAPPPDPASS